MEIKGKENKTFQIKEKAGMDLHIKESYLGSIRKGKISAGKQRKPSNQKRIFIGQRKKKPEAVTNETEDEKKRAKRSAFSMSENRKKRGSEKRSSFRKCVNKEKKRMMYLWKEARNFWTLVGFWQKASGWGSMELKKLWILQNA